MANKDNQSFYTFVGRAGNHILWRGYENGNPFIRKVNYKPSLYVPTKTDTDCKLRSMKGDLPLKQMKFDTLKDASDFIERYRGVSGFEIYGNSNFVAAFIQEQYPDVITFDERLINAFNYDIEVDISSEKKYDESHKIKIRKKK
jgi:hypothetical protein